MIMLRPNNRPIINSCCILLLSTLVLASCRFGGNNMQRYESVSVSGWLADSPVRMEVPVSDTVGVYDVALRLRHTDDYPYSNLWLFVTTVAPDNTATVDTVNIRLADEYGRWFGSGIGASIQYEFLYRQAFRFDRSGLWHIAIQQGMQDSELEGITAVGIKVSAL